MARFGSDLRLRSRLARSSAILQNAWYVSARNSCQVTSHSLDESLLECTGAAQTQGETVPNL
eukprot:366029-Chlamydomonas_euryale.AAC.27